MAKKGIKPTRLSVELNVAAGTVVINNQKRDGETFINVESASYSYTDLPAAIKTQVALYGLNKLLQDRTSQLRSETIPLSEVMKGISEVYATLASGEWSAKRKASAKGEANDDAVLIAVIADKMHKPVAVVAAMFAKLPADQKKAFGAKFADEVAAAKAEAESDADEFFGGM